MDNLVNDNPVYVDFPIPEFRGNPCVEAIARPPKDNDEAILRLSRTPYFDPSELELDASLRMLLPARLFNFMFPTGLHVKILKRINLQIFNGYRHRNPLSPEGQRYLHEAADGTSFSGGHSSPLIIPASISFLTGLSGMGKSALARAVMASLGKPVIKHSMYHGLPFPETQILYLMRNVPDQCSARALCKSFGEHADYLLAQRLYSDYFSDKSLNRSDIVVELRRIIVAHHIAALVIDNFENLSLARSGGKKELIALIVNLREELGVPILIVGTYKAAEILRDDASVTRRLVGDGFYELKRPLSCEDEDYRGLVAAAWDYHWTKERAELNEEMYFILYDLSQGITAIVLTLLVFAQVDAIDNGTERVDASTIKNVYTEQFKPLHGIIDALRSGDSEAIGAYDDLYLRAFKSLKADMMFDKIDAIREEYLRQQEAYLGMTDIGSSNARKLQKRSKRKYARQNHDSLLTKVTEGTSTLADIFPTMMGNRS